MVNSTFDTHDILSDCGTVGPSDFLLFFVNGGAMSAVLDYIRQQTQQRLTLTVV
jgi:hypothetical protein